METQVLSPETIQDTETPNTTDSIPADLITSTFSSTCIDLISAPLLPRILSLSNEFFAPAHNLLTPTPPISRPNTFLPTGAWYDGWETRRHNPSPPDYVIIALGVASGRVLGVEIDTAFFSGNEAPAVSVQGCFEPEGDERVSREGYDGWKEVLGKRGCGPSRRQAWRVEGGVQVTHVRLCMHPDGGIARFRLYGVVIPVWPADRGQEVELSAAVMGGVAVRCSDEHFGKMANLLLPGRGADMGDGWETRRSRSVGHEDWVVVKLGAKGVVARVEVDTRHFLGNFARGVRVEGWEGEGVPGVGDERWVEVLGEREMGPDRVHVFGRGELRNVEERGFTHVRMTMIPDGGVKRLRIFGTRM